MLAKNNYCKDCSGAATMKFFRRRKILSQTEKCSHKAAGNVHSDKN